MTQVLTSVVTRGKSLFTWLEPPAEPGDLTVVAVHQAQNPQSHAAIVRAWACDVWRAWHAHHDPIAALVRDVGVLTR